MNCKKRSVLWSSITVLVLTALVCIVNPAQTWGCDDHNTLVKTDYGKLRGYVNEEVTYRLVYDRINVAFNAKVTVNNNFQD